MHGLVRELALQVYKTICNNIFKLGGGYGGGRGGWAEVD